MGRSFFRHHYAIGGAFSLELVIVRLARIRARRACWFWAVTAMVLSSTVLFERICRSHDIWTVERLSYAPYLAKVIEDWYVPAEMDFH